MIRSRSRGRELLRPTAVEWDIFFRDKSSRVLVGSSVCLVVIGYLPVPTAIEGETRSCLEVEG